MKKKAEQVMPATPASVGYRRITLGNLLLDAANPRLAELGVSATASQFEVLNWLWDEMAVEEVGGEYVVIEGNRRLAAVKLLGAASR